MHKRLNYANVTATLALFFAMSGGALAAKHYLINSTKQFNPKVLKALKGNTGTTGASGASGAIGVTGKEGPQGKEGKEGLQGKEGKEGPFATTLPSGKTTTGAWDLFGSELAETSISFPFPLASRPTVHVVARGESPPSGCSGSVVHPGAARGNLCIFEGWHSNFAPGQTKEFVPEESGENNESGFTGAVLYGRPEKPGQFEDAGTFAVTAP
jgi:collagen triple helix repeat protein